MSGTVDTIKERLSIVDVVGSYVQLTKSGKYFKGRSPFSNERTPSFYVTPDKNLYHCFSTNKGGDIFTFIQEMEGVDFAGALKILAERAGVELVAEDPKKRSERDQLFAIMEEAARWYEKNLTPQTAPHTYLKERGVKDSSISTWRIGFVSDGWHGLSEHLKRTVRATDAELVACGLAIKGDRGYYDRFRSRIMFPISDASGRVVAFTGRAFGEAADKGPKYMNSPETQLFDKSSVLYGFNKAKSGIHRMGYAVLVEGQMDLIMSHQAGVTNTVASSGTALTLKQLELIHRIAPRVVVAYDADGAGVAASERAYQLALEAGMDVKVVSIPDGKDPADTVAKDPELWKNALRSARHLIEYKLDAVVAATADERLRAKKVSAEIVPYIARVESAIEQAHYVQKVCTVLHLPDAAVWDEVKRVSASLKKAAGGTHNPQGQYSAAAKQTAVSASADAHAWQSNDRDPVVRLVSLCQWLAESPHEGVDGSAVLERVRGILGDELARVEQELAASAATRVLRINEAYAATTAPTLRRELEELAWHIEIDHLQAQRSSIMKSLAAPPGEAMQEGESLKEYQELTKRIHVLQDLLSR